MIEKLWLHVQKTGSLAQLEPLAHEWDLDFAVPVNLSNLHPLAVLLSSFNPYLLSLCFVDVPFLFSLLSSFMSGAFQVQGQMEVEWGSVECQKHMPNLDCPSSNSVLSQESPDLMGNSGKKKQNGPRAKVIYNTLSL